MILPALATVAFASSVEAGANAGAGILVETGLWTKTTSCATLVRSEPCTIGPTVYLPPGPNNYIAVYAGSIWYNWNPLSVIGIDFGIQYNSNAVVVTAWNKCGDLDLPTATWPASGSGISMVWAAPQNGLHPGRLVPGDDVRGLRPYGVLLRRSSAEPSPRPRSAEQLRQSDRARLRDLGRIARLQSPVRLPRRTDQLGQDQVAVREVRPEAHGVARQRVVLRRAALEANWEKARVGRPLDIVAPLE